MATPRPRSKRMPAADRREKIIEGAAFAFAEHGFAAATTKIIAQRAGVSEALLYRHFKSKTAIYRAVLRRLMKQQDVELDTTPRSVSSVLDYVRGIRAYLGREMDIRDGGEAAIGHRLMTASLAGDGRYARLIYRRALRLRQPGNVAAVFDLAAAEGVLADLRIDPINASLLMQHVGGMLSINHLSGERIAPYAGDREKLLRDALLFCTRGLGISDEVVRRLYAEEGVEL